ncbi:hypothetical protein B0A55_11848 [Friedmanniomyces simplex]|uniref:Uncharacterized protein n=1 Tax=Friedmanniomyces simplex TaxID=329884 RepID=A0A4U0VVZ9_9PEZI|nr:hypothetical protein B0A55_11848 [Friedmanniomyces simplex]
MSKIVKPRHELEEELRLAKLEIEVLEARVVELERAYQLSAERLGANILELERTYQGLSRQEESSDAADDWGTAGAPSLHAVGNWDDDRLNRNATWGSLPNRKVHLHARLSQSGRAGCVRIAKGASGGSWTQVTHR